MGERKASKETDINYMIVHVITATLFSPLIIHSGPFLLWMCTFALPCFFLICIYIHVHMYNYNCTIISECLSVRLMIVD